MHLANAYIGYFCVCISHHYFVLPGNIYAFFVNGDDKTVDEVSYT